MRMAAVLKPDELLVFGAARGKELLGYAEKIGVGSTEYELINI